MENVDFGNNGYLHAGAQSPRFYNEMKAIH